MYTRFARGDRRASEGAVGRANSKSNEARGLRRAYKIGQREEEWYNSSVWLVRYVIVATNES